MTIRTTLGRAAAGVAAVAVLVLGTASPALAYQPVNIVHTEDVQAGPYQLTIGFSVWPLRAQRSLDWVFIPGGGIADKTGTLSVAGPDVPSDEAHRPLVRHPRRLDVWGLDVESLDSPGDYTFTFDIDGPQGPGTGTLAGLNVLDQPGPPPALSWAVCAVPLVALIAFLVIAWRRARPSGHLLPLPA
ncbi:hypothetical protein [Dactylosporangium sp. CA-092794]|uniref:hypothetical protein n=1 Tax=Dactylosporangium sp. CA-092794 TaxID=3239929 RepID=UPI003D8A5B73